MKGKGIIWAVLVWGLLWTGSLIVYQEQLVYLSDVNWLCRGMEEMAERREFPSLAAVVRARRRGYQISTLAALFITPFLLHSEMVAPFLLTVPVYSSTLFLLLIAFSFRRMAKEMTASIEYQQIDYFNVAFR